ncbi:MAG: cytochrome c oxidase accessory protein CcoG, partial [Candidatus Rokubacteria bacterium]|nr:cytochrome c oxidase accessory protein CcoG [Candidatus Rokubacteria bacterium]
TILGTTFLPTDTVLLALSLVLLIVGICLATALIGRVWCGWLCPQTVYLEFVYRPIERFFDGAPGPRHKPGKRSSPVRKGLKYGAYLLVSMYLAHTFLAYFVGVDALSEWIRRSPFTHPVAFLVMAGVTALMMFDFSYFREQACIVVCPYGRFQSVMLDRNSLIVGYDQRRGEPRGRSGAEDRSTARGDCVDCGLCTDCCPMGIDIRDGLQMECVACTQCIDACDSMMSRLGRASGLIRFSSQARLDGEAGRLLRPRVILYPAIMVLLASGLALTMARKQTADVTLLRGLGSPFVELKSGEISNQIRVKITHRGHGAASYRIECSAGSPARLAANVAEVALAPGESATTPVLVTAPISSFHGGRCDIALRVSDGEGYSREFAWRMLGPREPSARKLADSPGVRP